MSQASTNSPAAAGLKARSRVRWWELALLVAAIACWFVFPDQALLFNEITILALFAVSLDLILGYTGIVSLGHAAFFGLGAYGAALFAKYINPDPLLGLVVALALPGLVGLISSVLVMRGSDLTRLMVTLGDVSRRIPIVFPCHPRTRKMLDSHGLTAQLGETSIELMEPVGYRGMLGLMQSARCVLTDSGGLQEETTALGIPCLTLRDNTERPITVELGTSMLVGTEPAAILGAVEQVLAGRWKAGRVPDNWDGRAGERIVNILDKSF